MEPTKTKPTRPTFDKADDGTYMQDEYERRFIVSEYERDYADWRDQTKKMAELGKQAFALLIGQCSVEVHTRLTAAATWDSVDNGSDLIGALRLIEKAMTRKRTTQYSASMLLDAQQAIYNCRQGRNMSNNAYYEEFMDTVHQSESLGAGIGTNAHQVDEILADADWVGDSLNPTKAEVARATKQQRNKALAIIMLENSNTKRYVGLRRDLRNAFLQSKGSTDNFPKTPTATLRQLEGYKPTPSGSRQDDGGGSGGHTQGYAFVADNQGRGGRTGRGNGGGRGGRGGGRGAQGGRGHGGRLQDASGQGRTEEEEQYYAEDEQDNSGNTSSTDAPYPIRLPRTTHVTSGLQDEEVYHECLQALGGVHQRREHLLLDICSTVNLICNPTWVSNIRKSKQALNLHGVGGTEVTTQQASFGTFPEQVWFDENGVANILLFHCVSKHYRVVYDNEKEDTILVFLPSGQPLRFSPTKSGIYAYDATNERTPEKAWCFIQTVEGQKEKYTKREVKQAELARKAQNIMGFPASRTFWSIVTNNWIKNCPITRRDIDVAQDINGENIGNLVGKTRHRKNVIVAGVVDPVPRFIIKVHRDVVLAMDIFFINKIPFLTTISTKLHFGTVHHLKQRHITEAAECLEAIITHYKRRNFHPMLMKADGEFAPLEDLVPIAFNFCGREEHVPEVEQHIQTLKNRVRAGYNLLPFKHLPRLLLIQLVYVQQMWLNAFPHADSVSPHLSPRYLMTGWNLDFDKHVKLEFGAFVQTHEEHSNGMPPRTLSAINMGPSGNEQGGHYFLSLVTWKRIHCKLNEWTPLPMPRDVITAVSRHGQRQGMPAVLTFGD